MIAGHMPIEIETPAVILHDYHMTTDAGGRRTGPLSDAGDGQNFLCVPVFSTT